MFNINNKGKVISMSVLIVCASFAFGFALIPLYRVFCDITGLNGSTSNITTQQVLTESEIDYDRKVRLLFITTLSVPGWEFNSEHTDIWVHPGETYTVRFWAKNKNNTTAVARAVPGVMPNLAALHMRKTECFCFEQQKFEPGEGRWMDVQFSIGTDLPKKIQEMSLSYTFFDITNEKDNT